MNKRILKTFQSFLLASCTLLFGSFVYIPAEPSYGATVSYEEVKEVKPIVKIEQAKQEVVEVEEMVLIEESVQEESITSQEVVTEEVIEPEFILSQEEIELMALVTMAEAEAEPEEGQRLVIDTILNRMDSEHFPDTVHEVIYQPNQFTSMWNGRLDRCYVRDDLVQLVKEEAISRYNSEVVFFRTGRYSDYGEPLFLVGHHYFSRY